VKKGPIDRTASALSSPSSDSFEALDGENDGGLLILVDHASNFIPAEYQNLGLPETELARHIAYDIGAGALARVLAERFRAPAILTRFSRLLIDANRGEDDPTLIMRLSDGAIVPGNAAADPSERERRLDRFHRPYHNAIVRQIDSMLASVTPPAILSLHSYTPVWKGNQRPWHAGILWYQDPRFARPLIEGSPPSNRFTSATTSRTWVRSRMTPCIGMEPAGVSPTHFWRCATT
jgi:predicted N-formylglutamate amidohydrolase